MVFKQITHAIATNSILKNLFTQNGTAPLSSNSIDIDVTVRYTGKVFISKEEAKQISLEIEDDEVYLSTLAEEIAKRFLKQEERHRKLSQCDAIEEIYFNDDEE